MLAAALRYVVYPRIRLLIVSLGPTIGLDRLPHGRGDFDGLVSAPTQTETVAVTREQRIKGRPELLQQGLLD